MTPNIMRPSRDGDIVTTSPFKAWWFINWRRYRVETTVEEPRLNAFGRVKYSRTWRLAPPRGAAAKDL
jgi:hypothetical protein